MRTVTQNRPRKKKVKVALIGAGGMANGVHYH